MGIPRCTCVDAESKGMGFRRTKVIRGSFIHECRPRRMEEHTRHMPESHSEWLVLCIEPRVGLSSPIHV